MSEKPDLKTQMTELRRLLDSDQMGAAMALKASMEAEFQQRVRLPDMYSALPALLVFQEKHGNRYVWARTPEEYAKAGLEVLKERLEAGYYYLEAELPSRVAKVDLSISSVFLLDTVWTELSRLISSGELSVEGRHSEVMKAAFATKPGQLLRDSLLVSALTRDHLLAFWHDAIAGEDQLTKVQLMTAILMEVYAGHHSTLAGLAAHLRESRYGEAMEPVIRDLPTSEADRVRRILKMAEEEGALRAAGRMAHEFLKLRRRLEYEAVDLVQPDVPAFP